MNVNLRRSVAVAAFTLLSSANAADTPVTFSEAEIKQILSHGPWPMPAPLDATNRVSGNLEAIEFGTRLFFDERLSSSGQVACVSCHVPERNWTDNLRRGVGLKEVDRNTPTLINLRASQWYGWDGGADSQWRSEERRVGKECR